jgi:hypothetical protein
MLKAWAPQISRHPEQGDFAMHKLLTDWKVLALDEQIKLYPQVVEIFRGNQGSPSSGSRSRNSWPRVQTGHGEAYV